MSSTSLECFKEGYENHILGKTDFSTTYITDGGPENSCQKLQDFLNGPEVNIRKMVAQEDIIFSNSMAESANKTLKYHFLFPREIRDFGDTVRHLEKFIPENNARPIHLHHGFTAEEVFQGVVPRKNMFGVGYSEAVGRRAEENREEICRECD